MLIRGISATGTFIFSHDCEYPSGQTLVSNHNHAVFLFLFISRNMTALYRQHKRFTYTYLYAFIL
jgi:hypothetical protein